MMAVYLIVEVTGITDKERYAEYVRRVPGTVAGFGGTYLARGGEVVVAEGARQPGRVIIVEFPSMQKFRDWWGSETYRRIAPLREQSASTNAFVVQGI